MNSFTVLLESAILETEIKGCPPKIPPQDAEGKLAARDKVAMKALRTGRKVHVYVEESCLQSTGS